MLIAEYILRERTATGTMPANPAMVKTIVTTNMADPIAADYNVKLIEVLTGFKYIGEQIKLFEQTGSNNYVFGLEESYGCLAGTHARDKDARGSGDVPCARLPHGARSMERPCGTRWWSCMRSTAITRKASTPSP